MTFKQKLFANATPYLRFTPEEAVFCSDSERGSKISRENQQPGYLEVALIIVGALCLQPLLDSRKGKTMRAFKHTPRTVGELENQHKHKNTPAQAFF